MAISPSSLSDDEGMNAQEEKRGLFVSSGMRTPLTSGQRCVPEELIANWNFYSLNRFFPITFLAKMSLQNIHEL